jgi:hypothetical protein
MFQFKALIIFTAFSLVTPTLFAEDMSSEMNMNNMPGKQMQNNDQQSAQMQEEMKKIQDMYDQLMSAKTPEEKKTMMQTQMPMMQHGMNMMQNMGGDAAKNPEMMEKRMKMMQTMMEMMMNMMKDPQMMGCPKMKME